MPDGYYIGTYDDWYYVMSEKLLVTIPEIPETKSSIGKILLTGGHHSFRCVSSPEGRIDEFSRHKLR
jgi:hypothetical protein